MNSLITRLRQFFQSFLSATPKLETLMDTLTFNNEFSILIELCDDEEDIDYGLIDLTLIPHRKDRPNMSVVLSEDESEDFLEFFKEADDRVSLQERLADVAISILIEVETNYGDTKQPIVATQLIVLDPDIGELHREPLTGLIQRMFTFYSLLLAYHYDIMLERLLNDETLDEDFRYELLRTTFDLNFPPIGRLYNKLPIDSELPEDLSYLKPSVEVLSYTQEVKEYVETMKKVNVVASLESLMLL